MKTIVSTIIMYLLLIFFLTAFGGIFIMLYSSCASFVVGKSLSVFSIHEFYNDFLIFLPVTVLFLPGLLVLSIIRHSTTKKMVSGIITASILSVASWVFLVPLSYTLLDQENLFNQDSVPILSTGHFREIGSSIYYFTSVDASSKVNGVSIDKNYFSGKETGDQIKILTDAPFEFKRDKDGFADPVISKMMNTSGPLRFMFEGFFLLIVESIRALAGGIIPWLLFSSIIIALASTGALASCTSWRLANAFYVLFLNLVIIVLNFMYFSGLYNPAFKKLSSMGLQVDFLQNNFQVIMNGIITLILLFWGIFAFILNHKKSGDAE